MPLTRGQRRHLVSLTGPGGDPVPDGEGGYEIPMVPLDPPTWWCAIHPASQRTLERLTAGTTVTTASYIVEGDYHPGITTQTEILTDEGKTLYVNSLQDLALRHITTLAFCSEVAP